jgi:lysophospholipase L1-like esterase
MIRFGNSLDNFTKKFILLLIVCIEIAVGFTFLFAYNSNRTAFKENSVLGLATTIDSKTLIYPSDEEYKYYFEFVPNEKVTVTLPWDASKTVTYSHNDDGLNDVHNYQIEKQESTFRIVTLGDSFTYGQFVNTAENWTELLEVSLNAANTKCENKRYTKYEVINLGAPGFDISYIVKRYIEKGKKYNPNLVIWFESGTGFSRFNELLGDDQIPCNHPHECEARRRLYLKENYSSRMLRDYLKSKFDLFFSHVAQQNVIYFAQLKPFNDDLYTTEQKIEQLANWQSIFPQATMQSKIPTLYEEDIFIDGHPNQFGHQKIAKAFFDQIVAQVGDSVCQ